MSSVTQVWSCGGGTQSAAIAALICQKRLPKPDLAVIVDTEREKESTWLYVNRVLIPNLIQEGVTLEIVPKSEFATCDLYSVNDENLLLPVFTTQGGDIGKLPTYCSGEWKREILKRWARSKGVEQAECWVGISRDEMQRVRTPRCAWWQERYPLIFDVPLTRGECIRLVMDEMGWPEPPRSSCWMCPNMGDREWREIKENRPDEFAKAVQLERELQERDPHAWLHSSCKPLDTVDFSDNQMKLTGCDSGYCFV